MHCVVISLFPEMFEALTEYGVSGRAISNGQVKFHCINPRQFAEDRHQTIDDRPYGGGPGMVMMVEPLVKSVEMAQNWLLQQGAQPGAVIYLSPQGKLLRQPVVAAMSSRESVVLIAGRYEGIDERFIEDYVDEELSIGDYVLSGGELPAMVLLDAMIRLIPGVLGDVESAQQDSFSEGLLDCPHYTRPAEFAGRKVPSVLMSGDHKKIASWRLQQSLGRTQERRPDLIKKLTLSEEQQNLLDEYIRASSTK